MRSTTALLVLLAHLFALTAAHRDWWLKGLPTCWQSCFADTEDGCSSSSCICNTSASSSSYLPDAVSCAVSKCDADDWALELVLGPLDLLCRATRCPIPKDVIDAAYAAAADDASPETPPPSAPRPTKKPGQTPSASYDAPELTSTVRSTLTKTTTDSNGHTLQVVVPIAVGPSGVVTGSMSTSTLSGRPAATASPSAATTSPPAHTSLPELSLLPSSTAPAPAPANGGGAAGGNGSPFDVSAATSRFTTSISLSSLGVFAMVYLTLVL